MQSGSNYLEAGWQVQPPNSATVLIQLDGDIAEGVHIMVLVFPFYIIDIVYTPLFHF